MLEPVDCRFRGFYGRQRYLGMLTQALRGARDSSKSATVLITADSGLGKSRLLREFAASIAPSICVLSGGGVEYSRAPYGVIVEALESDRKPARAATDLLQGGTDERMDSDSARRRRFGAVERHLRRRAAESGAVVLLLDDLQWSDASTLDALHFLTRQLDDAPVLIVGAYRSEDVETDLMCASALARLLREGANRVELPALGRKHMLDAIAEVIPHDGSVTAGQVRVICELAEGSPFIAEELLGDAAARRHDSPNREAVVLSIRASVLERVKDFSEDEREALLYAAVLGRRFDVAFLARLARKPESVVLSMAQRSKRRRIFEEEASSGAFTFRHAMTREVLRRELLLYELRDLHARIAEQIEEDEPTALDEIAYHLWAAQSPRAVEANKRAAQCAEERHAYAAAASAYERAFSVASPHDRDYVALLERLSFALTAVGSVERARELCERAIGELHGTGERDAAIRLMLWVARQSFETGDVAAAMSTLDEVSSRLKPDDAGILHFDAAVTRATFLALLGTPRESLALLERAAALEVEKGPVDSWDETNARGVALFGLADYGGAIEAFSEAVRIAGSAGRSDLVALSHSNLGAVVDNSGQVDESIRCYEAGLAAARAGGHDRFLMILQANLAQALLARGDVDRAAAVAEALRAAHPESALASIVAETVDVRILSLTLAESNAFALIPATFARAMALGSSQFIALAGGAVAHAHLSNGDPERARQTLRETLENVDSPECAHQLIDVAGRVGSEEDTAKADNLLRRLVAKGNNPAGSAARLLFDARLAARRGDEGEARSLALRAAEAFRSFPWPVEEAEALEVAGDLEGALAIYKRIGATRPARRLEDALGVRRSPQTRAAGVLSRREEEVCDLLVRGRSYKAIAEELGIGERTVETHAHSVYRKLGVKTRLELVAQRSRAS